MNGEGGIRTHAPLRTNGFQDRLVMTTSIPLHNVFCCCRFVCLTRRLVYNTKPEYICQHFFQSFFILFRSQISSDVIFSCRSFSDVDYLTIAVYSMSTAFLCFFDNYFCHPYIVFFFIKATIYGWHFSFYNRYVIFMVPEI